jgi:hypothetical protein
MLPLAAPPTTSQVTAVFVVPMTVAVNCIVFPTTTLVAPADTLTLMTGDTVPLLPQEIAKGNTENTKSRKYMRRIRSLVGKGLFALARWVCRPSGFESRV